MKIYRYSTVFLVIQLLFVSCKDERVFTIPIKQDSLQRIIIPIEFNGKMCDFLFDTGSSNTRIGRSEDIDFTKLNMKSRKDSVYKIDSTVIATFYPKGTFKIGDFQTETSFYKYSEDNKKNLLGLNIISKYYWFFDFDKNIVKVSKSPISFPEKEALALKYNDRGNAIFEAELRFNTETKFKFLFDTGAGGNGNAISLFIEDSIPFKKIRIDSTDLTYQINSDPVGWVSKSLSVDNYKINYPLFCFENNLQIVKRLKSKGIDGLIPVLFVHRYSMLYIDPRQKKIMFFGEKKEVKESLRLYFEDMWAAFKRDNPNK